MPARAPSLFWLRGGSTPVWNHQRQQQLAKYFPKPRGESQCQPWAHQHRSPAPLACQSSAAFLARQARRLIPLSKRLAIGNSNSLELPWQPNTQTGKSEMWERGILYYQADEPPQATWSAPNHIVPNCSGEGAAIPQKEIHRKSYWHEICLGDGPQELPVSKSHTWCRDDKEQVVDMTAATGSLQHPPGLPFPWVSMNSSGSLPCSGLGEKSNLIQCWHCAQCQVLSFTRGPLQLHRKVTSLEEPRKKLVSNLGLHVIPKRDSWPPMPPLSSSSMLASETFDPQTFRFLKEKMDQQQGS